MHQIIFILILFLFNASIQSLIEAKLNDFSIDLIHRDSPLSPFYDHAATPSELMRNAALRSLSRAKFFHSYTHNNGRERIESSLSLIGGEYVMKFHVGSPPVELFAMADTGSNLIWLKCSHQSFFNPRESATYENVLYDSKFCQLLQKKWRKGSSNACQYNHTYRDGSYTTGNLSTDTFYLYSASIEGQIPFEEIVFGCSQENYLHNQDGRLQGVVGLGAGVLSLISQLKTKIEPKFSYCLVPWRSTVTSKVKFGRGAKISDSGVVSTPITLKHPPQYYHLSLESISIGNDSTGTSLDQGNIIIDSGTLFTVLHKSLYNDLKAIVIDAINSIPILDGDAPEGYNLCYEVKSIKPKDLPEMVFHFTSAAKIHLPWQQTFARCSDDLMCMTIVPDDRLSIFGSRAQVNFQVEFDLQNLEVSFARANCTTFT